MASFPFVGHLLPDPKPAVGQALGVALPDALTISVHEESAAAAHVVLPPGSRLTERDLSAVAGAGEFGNWDEWVADW